MSDHPGSGPEDDLLREGLANYLDAMYALHRFRRQVTETAVAVWKARISDVVEAVGLPPAVPASFGHYCNPNGVEDEECDGNWAWVASQVWFPAPFEHWFYIGLKFTREDDGSLGVPYVNFSWDCKRVAQFNRYHRAFSGVKYYWRYEKKECGFERRMENPKNMSTQLMSADLNSIVDHTVAAWKGIGGWAGLRD